MFCFCSLIANAIPRFKYTEWLASIFILMAILTPVFGIVIDSKAKFRRNRSAPTNFKKNDSTPREKNGKTQEQIREEHIENRRKEREYRASLEGKIDTLKNKENLTASDIIKLSRLYMKQNLKSKFGDNVDEQLVEYKTRRRTGFRKQLYFDAELRPVQNVLIQLAQGYPVAYESCFEDSISANLIAKEGYAVGGIRYWTIRTSRKPRIAAVQFIFMKIEGDRLNTNDSYESNRFGRLMDESRAKKYQVLTDGRIVCGINSNLSGYPALILPARHD